jgi:hypothetical protein
MRKVQGGIILKSQIHNVANAGLRAPMVVDGSALLCHDKQTSFGAGHQPPESGACETSERRHLGSQTDPRSLLMLRLREMNKSKPMAA